MKIESVVLAVISGYELVALISGRVPTVTNLVCRIPRRYRTVVSLLLAGWLVRHFDAES